MCHLVNTVSGSEMVASEVTVEINMLPAVTVASRSYVCLSTNDLTRASLFYDATHAPSW